MFVGLEAAELEYQNKTPYEDEPTFEPWEDMLTYSTFGEFLRDTGRCHEAIADYLGMDHDSDMDEDQAMSLLDMIDNNPVFRDWLEHHAKRGEYFYRDAFDKWWRDQNGGEEC